MSSTCIATFDELPFSTNGRTEARAECTSRCRFMHRSIVMIMSAGFLGAVCLEWSGSTAASVCAAAYRAVGLSACTFFRLKFAPNLTGYGPIHARNGATA